jgi:hypothetical protein
MLVCNILLGNGQRASKNKVMANLSWQFVTFAIALIATLAAILALSDARARQLLLAAMIAVGMVGLIILIWSYRTNPYEIAESPSQSIVTPPATAMKKPPDNKVTTLPERQQTVAQEPTKKPPDFIPDPRAHDEPQKCVGVNKTRLDMIAKISNSQSRDFEYGSFVLALLYCKSFAEAVGVTSKISGGVEHDGALTLIAITAMKANALQDARAAVSNLNLATTRDLLTSILINEMSRPPGYDPNTTTYSTDLIKLDYGSLGGATYDFRTGRLIDEFSPCVRGRASCLPIANGYDLGPYDAQYSAEPLNK